MSALHPLHGRARTGALYGFATMIMFGLCYYMVPRLTRREGQFAAHPHSLLVRAIGIVTYFAALSIGGWWQGRMLNNPDVPFANIVDYLLLHLFTRSVAGVLLTTGRPRVRDFVRDEPRRLGEEAQRRPRRSSWSPLGRANSSPPQGRE